MFEFHLNTGFFSRNRDIVGDSSFSVLGWPAKARRKASQ